jgi:hypothetical protein
MKTDVWIKLILWATMLMFVPLFFIVPKDEVFILAITTALMAVFILPLFSAYYELSDTDLIFSVYGFKKRVKYENIKSIRLCKNYLSSSAMSRERIEIVQHHKNKIWGTSYISPQNREDFFYDLKLRCRNLDLDPDEIQLNS